MTTNHRPTLESKKGKKRPISDTISHVRSVTQQTTLKYRNDAALYDISSDEVKKLNEEINRPKKIKVIEQTDDAEKSRNPDTDEDSIEHSRQRKDESNDKHNNETDNSDKADDDEHSNSESDSESDFDSESESELLAELEKIKKEKELKKQEEEKKALEQNPLLAEKPKKSWRSSTFKKKNNDKSKADFTTNTLESNYHQEFLSKFIR